MWCSVFLRRIISNKIKNEQKSCCDGIQLFYCLEWPISQQTAKSKWTRADKRWTTYKKFLLRTLDFIRFLVIYFSCVLVFWSSSQNHTNFSLFVQASTCAPDIVCKGWEEIGKEVANDENCPESLRCLFFFLHQKEFFSSAGIVTLMARNFTFLGDWLCSGYRDAKKT